MIEQVQSQSACAYQRREDGIHEYRFYQESVAAIDQWYTHLDAVYRAAPLDSTVYNLVDLRRAARQPIAYAFRRGKTWLAGFDEMPHTRTAYLLERDALTALINSFSQLLRMRHEEARFFSNIDEAVAWLLREDG